MGSCVVGVWGDGRAMLCIISYQSQGFYLPSKFGLPILPFMQERGDGPNFYEPGIDYDFVLTELLPGIFRKTATQRDLGLQS